MIVGDLVRVVSRKFLDCGEVVKELDVGILVDEKPNGLSEVEGSIAYILGKRETVVGYQIGIINDRTKWELQSV